MFTGLVALVFAAAVPLSGTVSAADGTPVAGATVVVQQADGTLTVTTNAEGAYAISDLDLPAVVTVVAPGFAAVSRVVESSPADFRLAPASLAESVVVPAERVPTWRDPETGATILDAADLASLPALTIDEALKVVPGFSLFRRSPARQSNPTTHGVSMRGLSASGASRGLVLMDGVPLNDGFGGWVTWTRVPTLAVDRLDLTRGAAGDAFGSDAVGGVLQIVPPSSGTPAWHAALETGSLDLVSLDASAGGLLGGWVVFGAAGWLSTSGSIPVEPASRGPIDREADAEWWNTFGSVARAWGSRRLTMSAWGGRDDRGNGTVLQENRMSGGTFAARYEDIGRQTTFVARGSMSPNTFDQTFSFANAARSVETLTSTQTTDTLTRAAVVEVGHAVSRAHVTARAELSRTTADFVDVRSSGTTDAALDDEREAVSAQAGFVPTGRLSMNVGVRHEWRAAPDAGAGRDTATVGHARAVWSFSPAWFLRGSVASSHRWPTLNELVRNFQVGNVLTLANPDLQPEQAVSIDGAIGFHGRRWHVSVGGFRTTVDDAIANVTIQATPTIIRERQNAGDTRSTGVELDGEYRPGGGVRIRTALAFTDATFVQSAEAALVGNDLPQVPGAAFSFWADVPLPHGLLASGVVRSVGAQFDDDRNRFELASATQLDLGLSGRFMQLGWRVEVENVLDATIEVGRTPLVTIAPPRAIRVQISYGR